MADLEIIRQCCFKVLHDIITGKNARPYDFDSINQYGSFENAVAKKLFLIGEKVEGWAYQSDKRLVINDKEKFREVFWSLFIQGIIMLGINDANREFPFFSLTEYGKKCALEEQIIPHDPDNYLLNLNHQIPTFDNIAYMYLTESLQAFIRGLYISSMVTLGCAAEKLFLLLEEAYLKFLKNKYPAKATSYEKAINNKFIKIKFDELKKRLPNLPTEVGDSSRIPESLDIHLNSIFEIIRTTRNEVGHPTGRTIERQEMYAILLMFPAYCKTVYSLTKLFNDCSS